MAGVAELYGTVVSIFTHELIGKPSKPLAQATSELRWLIRLARLHSFQARKKIMRPTNFYTDPILTTLLDPRIFHLSFRGLTKPLERSNGWLEMARRAVDMSSEKHILDCSIGQV